MTNCSQCGGHLHRIHRTFAERFSYMAIYECRECKDISCTPRRFRYHLGKHPRCPKCGTLRITKLKQRDQIDPMTGSPLSLLSRIFGGVLYHCRFCRLQFYDRRGPVAEKSLAPPAERPEAVTPAS
jgi:hypothetical protein